MDCCRQNCYGTNNFFPSLLVSVLHTISICLKRWCKFGWFRFPNRLSYRLIPVVLSVAVCVWGMTVSKQRPHVAVTCLLLYFLSGALTHPDPRQREALIKLEASMQMGGQIMLTDAEQRLNSVLMKRKQEELWRADFPPALHFFKAKTLIRTSPIFSVLQKMPKGVFNVVPPILKHSGTFCTKVAH